jgi:hypothetical protein
MNEIALYQGYVIKLTKYNNFGKVVFLSNSGNKTEQIINAMIFRNYELATSWIKVDCEMIVESKQSDYEIIPFCAEFKY